ncbi:hypothetical protein [Actinoplanes sp. URMC 104]|uniref:hypothetical protein n=1 Tax=Actinoplanes sp. URMC 104 TaxID=3423409 RepID=UPI003F1E3937
MSYEVPDACTLPTAQIPLRLAEFDELFAAALREAKLLTATTARLRLTGPADRVRDLTARESACCSFFTFTVREPGPDDVVLDVEVPPTYAEVLASLVRRAAATLR